MNRAKVTLAVGYPATSAHAQRLVKGFTMDDESLKSYSPNATGVGPRDGRDDPPPLWFV